MRIRRKLGIKRNHPKSINRLNDYFSEILLINVKSHLKSRIGKCDNQLVNNKIKCILSIIKNQKIMNSALSWKKGWFSCAYQILAGDIHVGTLKEKSFSQSAIGTIDGKRYKFRMKGLLRQHTEIIDLDEDEVVGSISYSCWRPKATVNFQDQTMQWKYKNLWETKWELSDFAGGNVSFKGCSTKGSIEMRERHDFMVLAGLYVASYYQKMAVIYMAAIFPIFFI